MEQNAGVYVTPQQAEAIADAINECYFYFDQLQPIKPAALVTQLEAIKAQLEHAIEIVNSL